MVGRKVNAKEKQGGSRYAVNRTMVFPPYKIGPMRFELLYPWQYKVYSSSPRAFSYYFCWSESTWQKVVLRLEEILRASECARSRCVSGRRTVDIRWLCLSGKIRRPFSPNKMIKLDITK